MLALLMYLHEQTEHKHCQNISKEISDFFIRPNVRSSRQRKRVPCFVISRTCVRQSVVEPRTLRPNSYFQSLSVFVFRISLWSVDGGVFLMRVRRRDRRSCNAWRFFACGTAWRWIILSRHDIASYGDTAAARLSQGVLTCPSG